ncbi:MAG: hypothetical protein ACNA7E_10230, partial [Wenzhouxiangellaceae bacterium]
MSLLTELKRRSVIRVALFYVVAAWLLVQVAETVLPLFEVPAGVLRGLVILLVLGFIPAVIFAWVFEWTPEGIRREDDLAGAEAVKRQASNKLNWATLVIALLAIGLLIADRTFLKPASVVTPVAESTETVESLIAQPAESAERVQDNSIAVLPFADLSPEGDQQYFSDGIAEEILNLLAQVRDLTVIGRTSSFAFKGKNVDLREIGETLGVAYLLEGSVRKAGDDLRITAQLVRTDTGAHLWSESYDRRLENVFAIQSEIATAIADALRVSLVGGDDAAPVAQIAASIPAYERFLQARRLIQGRTRAGIEAARALLDEAMALDPDYAPAHAAAAQAVLLLAASPTSYGDIPLDQAVAEAQPLIDRALALDPNLAEAHAVQG